MIERYYREINSKLWPLETRALIKELNEKKAVYEKFNFYEIAEMPSQKIKWIGTESQLIYLFQELVNAKLLPDDLFTTLGGGYKLISQHFINKNGRPFKNTQLAQVYQNLRLNKESKPRNANKIDKLVSKTRDQ